MKTKSVLFPMFGMGLILVLKSHGIKSSVFRKVCRMNNNNLVGIKYGTRPLSIKEFLVILFALRHILANDEEYEKVADDLWKCLIADMDGLYADWRKAYETER